MSLKIFVLFITLSLLKDGQAYRLNISANNKINEGTVRMVQNVFIKKYPKAAIDEYISVVRKLYSNVPTEIKEGNFESVVLMVEGALYQTQIERLMISGNTRHYDVRNCLKRVYEESETDIDLQEFNEKTLELATAALDKEFPSEVGQIIASIFTRLLNAKTLEESRRAAFDATILSLDGARVVTSRLLTKLM